MKPEDFTTSAPTERKSSPPGAFPETPANEVNEFLAKPIPATGGTGNPVQLKPGEKVPEHTGDVNSTVTTSKEDYEKAGSVALPVAAGTLGAAAAGSADEKNFSLPERSKNLIPESSLPVEAANPTIQSSGAGTTTSELAAQVPLEPKREAKVLDDGVPEVVKESIAESKQGPEATTNPEAVEEKKAVEAELLKEIKPSNETGEPAPAASSSAPVETAAAAAVPETVKESIAESKQGPEAAASSEAVKEKSEVEAELLKEIKPTNATGEPAPTAAAASSETAPAPTTSTQEAPEVTTGPETSKTEAKSTPETPSKSTAADTPASSTQTTPATTPAEEKKKKRKSFFGKLKEKLK